MTAYRRLADLRDWLRDAPDLLDFQMGGGAPTDFDLTDILDIIHLARDAATLCACPTPKAGTCKACKLERALTHAGVPKS